MVEGKYIIGLSIMIAIGVMLATSACIVSVNAATNGTAGNVSKASNATLTNATKVGGGVLSNVSKAIGGGLKGLGNMLSGGKKWNEESSNSDEIPGSPKGMGIVQEYNDQHSFYY